MLIEVILGLVAFVLAYGFYIQKRPRGFPPGPQGIPLLGYAPFLAPLPHIKFTELAEIYGNIYSVFLGNLPVVVLNDVDDIREAFKQDVFSGRPKDKLLAMEVVSDGIVFNEGRSWMEHRRFSVKVLRDLGFGKKSMNENIMDEVKDLIAYIRNLDGKPFDPKLTLQVSIINALWMMIANQKFGLEDPRAIHLRKTVYEGYIEPEQNGPAFFMPWLARAFPKWTSFDKVLYATEEMNRMLSKEIAEHEKTYSREVARDYIDMVLQKIEETTDPSSSFYKDEGKKHAINSMLTFFTAGSDTLSTTLCYVMLYLAKHPDVQRKCQDEIQRVVGRERFPELEDRSELHYLEATMAEILRKTTIVSGGILHSTMEDVEFRGFRIPKRTIVMSNLWSVHHNPKLWDDPYSFKPERFLDENGKFKKNPNLIPFGVGKRYCPADHVGMMELYLYCAGLIQNFEFLEDPQHPFPPLDKPKTGLVLTCYPSKIVFKERV